MSAIFIIKKIVSPFLLPPGLLVIVLLAWGLWFIRHKSRWNASISLGLGAIIWIFSTNPMSNFLMGRLEDGFNIPKKVNADVIIMLTSEIYEKAPDFSGIGTPGPETMERLVTAARLQRHLKVPIIVSGGKVYSSSTSIAELARRFLIDLGIPDQSIILENQSRDTFENALYSKQICDQRKFGAPLVVTSGYHLKRAVFCFDKVGLKVLPFPCALTTWPDQRYYWYHLLPSAKAFAATASALREWLGLFFYHLRY